MIKEGTAQFRNLWKVFRQYLISPYSVTNLVPRVLSLSTSRNAYVERGFSWKNYYFIPGTKSKKLYGGNVGHSDHQLHAA